MIKNWCKENVRSIVIPQELFLNLQSVRHAASPGTKKCQENIIWNLGQTKIKLSSAGNVRSNNLWSGKFQLCDHVTKWLGD